MAFLVVETFQKLSYEKQWNNRQFVDSRKLFILSLISFFGGLYSWVTFLLWHNIEKSIAAASAFDRFDVSLGSLCDSEDKKEERQHTDNCQTEMKKERQLLKHQSLKEWGLIQFGNNVDLCILKNYFSLA
jgi:hypothetical protein